jgi:hypothetical protein
MSQPCDKGKIQRVGYVYDKKNGVHVKVKPTCIVDKGKPGKGPKLIKMPSSDIGLLSDYGYSLSSKYEDRIKAIKKSLKEHSKLKILKHINALRTLQKSNPTNYNKLDKDFKWIHEHYDEY